MSVSERIRIFTSYKRISMREFERSCSMSNGYAGKIKSRIGNKLLESIILIYPEINPIWLQIGEGEMLKSNAKQSKEPQAETTPSSMSFSISFHELRTIETLNKIIENLTKINDRILRENEKLRAELERRLPSEKSNRRTQ